MKENFNAVVLMIAAERLEDSTDHEVQVACRKLPIQHPSVASDDMKGHPWTLLREMIDHWRNDSGGQRLSSPNPHLAGGRIGEKVDVCNALSQFVEYSNAALDEGPSIGRGLHTLPRAVEQSHSKRMLEIGNHL